MLSRDDRSKHARRSPRRATVEALETRQLMAYSPLGFSLPDLTVTAYAARSASWGGPLGLQVNVLNQGASSINEPTNLAPGSISTADAPATSVTVFASTRPNTKGKVVQIGTVAIPATPQNSESDVTTTIALPPRPAGFRANGTVYLTLVVNNDRSILELNYANNVTRLRAGVTTSDPLPDLQVVALDIPAPLQPGDVIAPTIRIANFGNASTAPQGPITVILVASLNKTFGPGDAIIGSYTLANLPGQSQVPTTSNLAGDQNVMPPANFNTTTLAPLQLPTTPNKYSIGVIIDPDDTIVERTPTSAALQFVQQVGPKVRGLPNTTKVVDIPVGTVPVFPELPSNVFNPVTSPVVVTPVTPVVGDSDYQGLGQGPGGPREVATLIDSTGRPAWGIPPRAGPLTLADRAPYNRTSRADRRSRQAPRFRSDRTRA